MSQGGVMLVERERFVTFEVAGAVYALPIADVLEVAAVGRVFGVPTLSAEVAGVTNHHGDALPVVARSALFAVDAATLPEPAHLLVIAGGIGETGRLGLPVDRVLGMADARRPPGRGRELIAARLPVEGRVTSVLDAGRLVERAAQVLARSARSPGTNDPERGGREV